MGDSRTMPKRARKFTGGGGGGGGSVSSVLDSVLPPIPVIGAITAESSEVVSPRASVYSTDSGIGTSVGGEVYRPPRCGSVSAPTSSPNSGSGLFNACKEGDVGGDSSGSSGPHSADMDFQSRGNVSGSSPIVSGRVSLLLS